MKKFTDPYLDPDTGLLRNLPNYRTAGALSAGEADLVGVRDLELRMNPRLVARSNSFAELLSIHRHLFQDLFAWAGKVRTVDIRKNLGGGKVSEFFLIVSRIGFAADFVFGELQADKFLKKMPKPMFANRLSYHYDQLNYIHPFREGNGRTQRLFWSRVASDAGYEIDWSAVTGDENNLACRLAMEQSDLSGLEKMFGRIVKKIPN